jgi:hypothetical protein
LLRQNFNEPALYRFRRGGRPTFDVACPPDGPGAISSHSSSQDRKSEWIVPTDDTPSLQKQAADFIAAPKLANYWQ